MISPGAGSVNKADVRAAQKGGGTCTDRAVCKSCGDKIHKFSGILEYESLTVLRIIGIYEMFL